MHVNLFVHMCSLAEDKSQSFAGAWSAVSTRLIATVVFTDTGWCSNLVSTKDSDVWYCQDVENGGILRRGSG